MFIPEFYTNIFLFIDIHSWIQVCYDESFSTQSSHLINAWHMVIDRWLTQEEEQSIAWSCWGAFRTLSSIDINSISPTYFPFPSPFTALFSLSLSLSLPNQIACSWLLTSTLPGRIRGKGATKWEHRLVAGSRKFVNAKRIWIRVPVPVPVRVRVRIHFNSSKVPGGCVWCAQKAEAVHPSNSHAARNAQMHPERLQQRASPGTRLRVCVRVCAWN